MERETKGKETNQRKNTSLIPSYKAVYLTTSNISPVHFMDPVGQDNFVKEEQKTDNWESHSITTWCDNVNSKIETMDFSNSEQFQRQCCKTVSEETEARKKEWSPNFNLQRKADVILKEENKQLRGKDEDIPNPAISASLFQENE